MILIINDRIVVDLEKYVLFKKGDDDYEDKILFFNDIEEIHALSLTFDDAKVRDRAFTDILNSYAMNRRVCRLCKQE